MKKILIIILCCFISISAQSDNNSCAGGQGTIIKGINGKTYCRSKMVLNWWSANAWCDSAQGVSKLVNPNEDCDCTGFDGCDTTISCPNFKLSLHGVWAWTNSTPTKNQAYAIDMGKGDVAVLPRIVTGATSIAVCK